MRPRNKVATTRAGWESETRSSIQRRCPCVCTEPTTANVKATLGACGDALAPSEAPVDCVVAVASVSACVVFADVVVGVVGRGKEIVGSVGVDIVGQTNGVTQSETRDCAAGTCMTPLVAKPPRRARGRAMAFARRAPRPHRALARQATRSVLLRRG